MIIGIGTDIIEIARIEKAVSHQHFFEKIYTDKERKYIEYHHKKTESLAGMFAAKEAVSKALGTGFRGFFPKHIEIIPNSLGKPEVTLYEGAVKQAERLGIKNIQLTISHCNSYAVAYVLLEGGE